jgi:plastocyanin
MKSILLTLMAALAAAPALAAKGTVVRGRILLETPDGSQPASRIRHWDLTQGVAYLIPTGGEGSSSVDEDLLADKADAVKPPVLVMHQKNAIFDPAFLVVAKGQSVSFVNEDKIDHNVFSFSKPKKFDLGIYPRGQQKTVLFDREGPVLIFCSIHEMMNAVIFVVPTQLFARTDAGGRFEIRDVPPGKYRLRTWHTALPEGQDYVEVTEVAVSEGKPVDVQVPLFKSTKSGSRR